MKETGIRDIEVFRGLDGVRKRPDMYLGSTTDPKGALLQTLKEIRDNALDEYLSGRVTKVRIEVVTKGKQTFLVADNGGGIPVEIHKTTKKSGLETVFTFLHAGGKFSNKEATVGTHGVGSAVVCAVSETFEAWTKRNGHWYHMSFAKGKSKSELTKAKPPVKGWKSGTIIKFTPDPAIFGKQQIKKTWVTAWFNELVYLCPGLTIELSWDGKETVWKSTKGAEAWLKDKLEELGVERIGKFLVVRNSDFELALCWSTHTKEELRSYVNCSLTSGGTHVKALYRAIGSAVSKFKNRKKYNTEDLRVGMIGLFNCRIKQPKFKGQVKDELSSEIKFEKELKQTLETWFNKNSSLARKILKQAVLIKSAKDNLKRQITAVKKARNSGKTGVLPGILTEADPSVPSSDRELFLLEGQSAGGTAKTARLKHQEVLTLRGKPPNALKTKPAKLFANETVKRILMSLGTGVGKECSPKTMRVGKVFFLADADSDGCHINALLLALFAEYFKPIVDAGKVFVVETPLFVTVWKDKKYFANSLKELKKQLPKVDLSKLEVVRMKGWAECSAEDLRNVAFDASTRKLTRIDKITLKHKKQLVKVMGTDSSFRKVLLGLEV